MPETPRFTARERFEDQLERHTKGEFRAFEAYLREKYGLEPVDSQAIAEIATERFNRHASK